MRLNKVFGASVATLALSLSMVACGSDDGDGGSDADGGDFCGKNLAFLGALTGDAGALGQNMVNGIELALKEYNADNADCKINLKKFDSQGSPGQGAGARDPDHQRRHHLRPRRPGLLG